MKQKDGMLMRKVNTVPLNETGEFLWNLLETDRTEKELAQALAKEYGITNEQTRDDVSEFEKAISEYVEH